MDADGDGYPARDDCDDSDPEVYPGAEEVCDEVDNDCDGEVDEGLEVASWYLDADEDGYGVGDPAGEGCAAPSGYVWVAGDCDDEDGAVNPGAKEVPCDGVDNDCDEQGSEAFQATLDGVEYHELQNAIDEAMLGDTVFVCPGVHDVSVQIAVDQVITLASWSGSAEDTVLTGGKSHRMLEILTGAVVTLRGLGFEDGFAEPYDGFGESHGGAVTSVDADLAVSECRFEGNASESTAGALAVWWTEPSEERGSLLVLDSAFLGNQAESGAAVWVHPLGGAVADVRVEGSVFEANREMGSGGGVSYFASGHQESLFVVVHDSDFESNVVPGDLHTGSALGWRGYPGDELTVSESRFASNHANSGGAIGIEQGGTAGPGILSTVTVTGCDFEDNSANNGGAIHASSSSGRLLQMFVEDSTFTSNVTEENGAAIRVGVPDAYLEVSGSVFEANQASAGAFLSAGGDTEALDLVVVECDFLDNIGEFNSVMNLVLFGTAQVWVEDSSFLGNTSTWDVGAISMESYGQELTFLRVVADGNVSVDDASFLSLGGGQTSTNVLFEDSAITTNSCSDPDAGAVLVQEGYPFTIQSASTDWGSGATDNSPCDLVIEQEWPARDHYCDLGAGESFTCTMEDGCF